MLKKWWPYLLVITATLLLSGWLLYLIHPVGPLLLLGTLVIQAPLIWLFVRRAPGYGYPKRTAARRQQYRQDGDAEAWLAAEKEDYRTAKTGGWPPARWALLCLNCADAAKEAGQTRQAAEYLRQVDSAKLPPEAKPRYAELAAALVKAEADRLEPLQKDVMQMLEVLARMQQQEEQREK